MREKIVINGFEYWMDKTGREIMFYGSETAQHGISIEDPNWTKDELKQIKELLKTN